MLRPAAIFRDHMVLQRDVPAAVFGTCDTTVTVTLADKHAEAVPENGRFLVRLPALPASGPYVLKLESAGEKIEIADVMIGEVWICGGQSNMEFRMYQEEGSEKELPEDNDPMLRFYTVPDAGRETEAEEKEQHTIWKALSPNSCADVSAIAYHAGRRLRDILGVPVGMVICCLGGTEIAHWMSRETLASMPEGHEQLAAFARLVDGITEERYEHDTAEYQQQLVNYWRDSERLQTENPGIRPPEIEKRLGPYPWPPPAGPFMPRRPAGLWENMTCRITPFTARGIFWYQGESDSGRAMQYTALLEAMIRDWRRGFESPTLPFIAAQLPIYGADPHNEDWAGIREAQQKVCASDPNCRAVCLLDCGEKDNLHPVDKRTAALRMADAALFLAYGIGDGASSPSLISTEYADGHAVLHFDMPLASPIHLTSALRVNGVPVSDAIVSENKLIVSAPSGAKIEYGQENAPDACLFGQSALPVFPFSATLPQDSI